MTNAAIDAVDVNEVIDDVDLNQVIERIDVNELMAKIDPDALMDRVDVNALLDRVDVNALLDRVDPDRLLDRVDPDRLLDRVTPDQLLDRVDPERLMDRVDVNALLSRVDPNELVARTDMNAALADVDFEQIVDRVDVKSVVEKAGVPELIQQSTGHMAESLLDVARRQIVAVDQIFTRVTKRVFHRGKPAPEGPANLVRDEVQYSDQGRGVVTGHYAGPLSRLSAFIIDSAVVFWLFTLISAGVYYVLGLLIQGDSFSEAWQSIIGVGLFLSWAFLYSILGLAIAGRTLGKGIVGLRVVSRSGGPIRIGQAFVRVVTMPLSFVLLGLGFIGLIVGRERRALHDILAGTVVVYDWGDRTAEVSAPLTSWLTSHEGPPTTHEGQPTDYEGP